MKELADALFAAIPTGVGAHRQDTLAPKEERALLTRGAAWMIDRGFGTPAISR